MEHSLYSYSLCASLTLMVFFAFYFIFAQVPDKVVYSSYLRSRRIIGAALLILVANYCVHFFVKPRFFNPDFATFMNLSTYFLEAWLFSSALTSLLDKQYLTRRRFGAHVGYWALYTVVSGVVFFVLQHGGFRTIAMLSMALLFFVYAVWLASRLLQTYKRAARVMDDYYSDNVVIYIRWMSRFTYWAAVFGVMVGGLTFLPKQYIFLWILSAIPFYIYLFVSFMNYLLFYGQVQAAFEETQLFEDVPSEMQQPPVAVPDTIPSYYGELADKLDRWIAERGFTASSITAAQLAVSMGSNRTYLTNYIKMKYGVSFRDWVSSLRIDYAKELLSTNPKLSVSEIANEVGYQSSTHFITLFSESENISPKKWRNEYAK